jgi:hypothetical protein
MAKKSCSDYVSTIDSFGVPITVNYKGSQAYKTIPGTFCTTIWILFIAALIIQEGSYLVLKRDPIVSSYQTSLDLSEM